MIRELPQRVRNFRGGRRLSVAFVCGALAAAAMQPLLFWPILFASFPVLVWLIDGIFAERGRTLAAALRAAATGWVFGFGYFLASLYWIGAAFLVEAETYAWMMPLALASLPAGMALYWGAAMGLAAFLWTPGLGRIFLAAVLLSLAEWLRGRMFTGFPWNAMGYAAEAFDGLSQSAAYIGIWGLTFLVLLWAMIPAALPDAGLGRRARGAGLLLLFLALPIWAGGTSRLNDEPAREAKGPWLRIVQPNVPQSDKWRSDNAGRILEDLITMSAPSAGPAGSSPALVVWPESSVPFLIDEEPAALALIAEALPDEAHLLMGSLRRTRSGEPQRVYNSLFVLDGLGRIAAVYDKQHLVPYGEYLPLTGWLEPLGLRRLVTVPGNFDWGPGPETISVLGIPPFSPLICYEAIFPTEVVAPAVRPAWLLNVTNDGWFGLTSGPFQHLAQARFRAIEQGLPLIRSANTGISAVIDANGRILESLPLAARGTIDANLPAPLPATFYARYGDLGFFLMIFLGFAAYLLAQRSPHRPVVADPGRIEGASR